MVDEVLYYERISSNRTEALFLALTIACLLLLAWRVKVRGLDVLAAVFAFLFGLFLFYSVNYRTLVVRLTRESLILTFGLFTWRVPLVNVEECRLDEIPLLLRMGGAGIHFMTVRQRYRVSFNFLEYPRVVVAFKEKRGPVRDLSFSTRGPDHILPLIQEAVAASSATQVEPLAGLGSAPPHVNG